MNSETVDLIATDPPFNKKRNRAGTAGQYEDAWRWTDHPTMQGKRPDQWMWQPVHREWLDDIKDENPALFDVIETTRKTQDDDTAAFLCFLSVRLLEMHRILKPTGSIYLHCDHSANAYIRMCMDAVFGAGNFRNEIVWRRYGSHNDASRKYGQVHDTILFYSKSNKYTWTDKVREPYDPEYLKTAYRNQDACGRYTTAPLHARGLSGGGYEFEWRGIFDNWRFPKDRLEEMDDQGLIHWPKRGRIPRRKVYLDESRGVTASDMVLDVTHASAKERTGSPDQKPLALYERIILASSEEGDLVLDPFAGCATTIIAARKHKRRWVGIDRRKDARFHVVCRMMGLKKADADDIRATSLNLERWLHEQLAKHDAHYRTESPERTDDGEPAAPDLPHVYAVNERSVFTHKEMKSMLISEFGLKCWGCYFDGSVYGQRGEQYLELDHINPKTSGGSNHLDNRALLCGPCNRDKSDTMTLSALRRAVLGSRKAANKHPIDLSIARQWSEEQLREKRAELEGNRLQAQLV